MTKQFVNVLISVVASIITIPCTKLFARMMRNKALDSDINDIYKEYKENNGKGMKAPFILNPPKKIHNTMDYNELNQLLKVFLLLFIYLHKIFYALL